MNRNYGPLARMPTHPPKPKGQDLVLSIAHKLADLYEKQGRPQAHIDRMWAVAGMRVYRPMWS